MRHDCASKSYIKSHFSIVLLFNLFLDLLDHLAYSINDNVKCNQFRLISRGNDIGDGFGSDEFESETDLNGSSSSASASGDFDDAVNAGASGLRNPNNNNSNMRNLNMTSNNSNMRNNGINMNVGAASRSSSKGSRSRRRDPTGIVNVEECDSDEWEGQFGLGGKEMKAARDKRREKLYKDALGTDTSGHESGGQGGVLSTSSRSNNERLINDPLGLGIAGKGSTLKLKMSEIKRLSFTVQISDSDTVTESKF
jgi:hypothetical protein